MEEIEIFEAKIKNIRDLIIDTTEHDNNKLIRDLNMRKGLEIERIKKVEIKQEKLKISKIIVDTIKKSVISEKCLHFISRHRRYCV